MKQVISYFMRKVKEDNIGAYAAQAALFFIMSMIPFLLVLLSLLFQSLPLKAVLASLIGVNCLLEMLAAAVVAVAVCKPLQRVASRAK